ncbi:precorrin-3B synthase [Reyranella sp.]|uniref:precorrin-3B synthase n=1 Tax=Reyranella sp. TaxID=1929291 RepID=UPI00378463A1
MSTPAIAVKGWCPGALQPMPSGDGLIVRIRPFCGALSLDQAGGLADLAGRLGNGHIDLTRRANLQIRGLAEPDLPALHERLGALDLIDRDAETEATRNLMVGPLAGLDEATVDVRPLARAILQQLIRDPRLRLLSPKFGLLVDGGGPLSIAGERADVALLVLNETTVALGIDTAEGTRWLGVVPIESAPPVAIAALHGFLDAAGGRGRMRTLPLEATTIAIQQRVRAEGARFTAGEQEGKVPRCARDDKRCVREDKRSARDDSLVVAPSLAVIPSAARDPSTAHPQAKQGIIGKVIGVAAPFGRLEAPQLAGLVTLAADSGAVDIRLSPWRTLYFGACGHVAARSAVAGAQALGLIVDPNDPLLRIDACPGAPDCESSSVPTRRDARALAMLAADHGYTGLIHVSGCAKGCARSDTSDLVLVGDGGEYGVAHKATARDAAERRVSPQELAELFAEARRG